MGSGLQTIANPLDGSHKAKVDVEGLDVDTRWPNGRASKKRGLNDSSVKFKSFQIKRSDANTLEL